MRFKPAAAIAAAVACILIFLYPAFMACCAVAAVVALSVCGKEVRDKALDAIAEFITGPKDR